MNNSALKLRLLNGAGASLFAQTVTLLVQLVSVPLLLKFWGVEQYGEWIAISAIPQYLALSNLGFATTAANKMTMLVSRNNFKKIVEIFQSAWVFVTSISIVIFIIALFISSILNFETLLKLNFHRNTDARVLIIILSGHTLLSLQGGLFEAIYKANLKFSQFLYAINIIRLLEFIMIVLVAIMGYGTIIAAAVFLVTRLTCYLIWFFITKKSCNYFFIGFKKASKVEIKAMIKPSIAFMAMPVGRMLNLQGLTLLVSYFLGPLGVVVYSTGRTISRVAFQVIEKVNNVIWPELSLAFGQGNISTARNLHRILFSIAFWISCVLSIFLFFFGDNLLLIWTDGKVIYNNSFMNTLYLGIILNSLWYVSSVVQLASNTHIKQSIIYLFSNIISVIIAIVLIPKVGLVGSAVAIVLSEILMVLNVIPKSMKKLEEEQNHFVGYVVKFPYITLSKII